MSDDLTTAYNLGYTCAKDMARDEIERLRAENEKLRNAIAAERERCAKIAENIYYPNEGKLIAAAIRETGDE